MLSNCDCTWRVTWLLCWQVQQRMQGRIQQWPQHVLQEGGPPIYEGASQVDATANKQDPSKRQPSWYGDGEEDEDDDILGGPRF